MPALRPIIGSSAALLRVMRSVEHVAPVDTTVLILGESGTGKELLAHAVHDLSKRRTRPFVKVNCAALPASLIEAELFGHEKGAFTDAHGKRVGRFEAADGGTLFLDEIGDLPLPAQPKLLRILEQAEFERVGGSNSVKIDVRVIAATNRDLAQAVQKGLFRADLYYRLSIYPITMPPLRDRPEDLPLLVDHFITELSSKLGKEIKLIAPDALRVLQNHTWPGNIRELRNVVERMIISAQDTTLRLDAGLTCQI